MNCDRFHELAALGALGVLSEAERAELDQFVRRRGATAQAELARFNDAIAWVTRLHPAPPPPPRVKARLLEQIRRSPRAAAEPGDPPPGAEPRAPLAAGFGLIRSEEGRWIPGGPPGATFKLLSINREKQYVVLLIDLPPGAKYPPHHHSGSEELYLLTGDLQMASRVLGPGDFHHADAGTDHGELSTQAGCTALMVVPAGDYLAAR